MLHLELEGRKEGIIEHPALWFPLHNSKLYMLYNDTTHIKQMSILLQSPCNHLDNSHGLQYPEASK
jgi:hypothetical protein